MSIEATIRLFLASGGAFARMAIPTIGCALDERRTASSTRPCVEDALGVVRQSDQRRIIHAAASDRGAADRRRVAVLPRRGRLLQSRAARPNCERSGVLALLLAALVCANHVFADALPQFKQALGPGSWPSTNRVIALRGNWLAVSVPGRVALGAGSNRIEIWRRTTQWSLHTVLSAPAWSGAPEAGLCASSLSFDSNAEYLIAGDPRYRDDSLGPSCGLSPGTCHQSCGERVRIFRRNGETWALDVGGDLQSQVPVDGSDFICRRFGYSVAIEGNHAIVGSPYHDPTGGDLPLYGAVEFFARDASGWHPVGVVRGNSDVSVPGCSGAQYLGESVLLGIGPLAGYWLASSSSTCGATRSYMHYGRFDGSGFPLVYGVRTRDAQSQSTAIRLCQANDKVFFNSDDGRAVAIERLQGDGSFTTQGTLLPPGGTVGTPPALLWGKHASASGCRYVSVKTDNKILVTDCNPTGPDFGNAGEVLPPLGYSFQVPVTVSNDLEVLTAGQRVVVDGGTVAVAAASGAILIYESYVDCDANGVADQYDILADPLRDCDGNNTLDVCEPLPVPAPAPTRSTWKAPLGGSFQDAANWCRQAPVSTTAIEFGLTQSYNVSFSQTREVKNISISNGAPILDLGGFTLKTSIAGTTPERFIKIGTAAGTPAGLSILGGTVNTVFGEVGAGVGTSGSLFVGPGGKLISTTEFCVGCEGTGQLLAQNGGQLVSQKAIIGKTATSHGTAVVEQGNAKWTATLGIDIKNGSLTVGQGGVIDSPALGVILYAGGSLNGAGTINGPVTNFGSAAGFCGTPGAAGVPAVHKKGGLVPGGEAPAGGGQSYTGDAIGTLTVNGLYQQIAANPDLGTNSGSLLIEVAKRGTSVVHDKLVVNGHATLGGGLFVTVPEGDPGNFSNLPIVTATTLDVDRNNFDVAFMPGLPNGRFVKVDTPAQLGGGGTISISTADLSSLFGFGDPQSGTVDAEPLAAVAADFDGVNGNDVAVTLRGTGPGGTPTNGALLVLFNDGQGGLSGAVQIPLGVEPVGIVAAPLHFGATRPDLAVVNKGSETIQVLQNNGIGVFTTTAVVSTGAGSAPTSIDAVPIYAEDPGVAGVYDLVVANSGYDTIELYFNPGTAPPEQRALLTTLGSPSAVRGVDIDNDRFFDFVVTNRSASTVSVFTRQPPPPKSSGPPVFNDALTVAVGEDPTGFTASDLDGDGLLDVTTVNELSNSVSVVLNRSAGAKLGFAPAVTLPTGGLPSSIVVGDFDQDTAPGQPPDLDIAFTARTTTATGAARVIKVLRNDRANGVLALAPADDIVVGGSPKIVLSDEFDNAPGVDLFALSLGGTQLNGALPPIASRHLVPNTPPCPRIVGDIDCSGLVDGSDLAALLGAWATVNRAADLDHDGIVGGSDLALLLGNWGASSN